MIRPRVEIVRGGAPTAREAAALAAVVLGGSGVRRTAEEPTPAWLRAARSEAVGRRPFVSADDLDARWEC